MFINAPGDRITLDQFIKFESAFFKKAYPTERYGQAFVNRFFGSGMTDSEVFYQTNLALVKEAIVSKYVLLED